MTTKLIVPMAKATGVPSVHSSSSQRDTDIPSPVRSEAGSKTSASGSSPPLPPLTSDEYVALKADIFAHGILVPIDIDSSGAILDGFQRQKIADELKLKNVPRRIIGGLTPEQKRHHRITVNLNRRHLTSAQKRAIVKAELKANPRNSNSFIATLCGITDKTVSAVRHDLEARSEIPKVAEFTGKDGKTYPRRTTMYTETANQSARATAALAALGDMAPQKILTLNRAESMVRQQKWHKPYSGTPTPPKGIELFCTDFRKWTVKPASIDLIVTDPLYEKKSLPLWGELAKFAAKTLKPGRLLLAYTGIQYLPDVMDLLRQHLTYHWTIGLFCQGTRPIHRMLNVSMKWRPVFVFSNGPAKKHQFITDAFQSARPEKQWHEYQQSLPPIQFYIERLTKPGQLVCDPFLGSGTTAVACRNLGRRFVGCDIDPTCISRTKQRLTEEESIPKSS
jgi:hypothetical protein